MLLSFEAFALLSRMLVLRLRSSDGTSFWVTILTPECCLRPEWDIDEGGDEYSATRTSAIISRLNSKTAGRQAVAVTVAEQAEQ